jgi:hypothetical protein
MALGVAPRAANEQAARVRRQQLGRHSFDYRIHDHAGGRRHRIGLEASAEHCISMSSCEAELNALAEFAIEVLHVSAMLTFIGHVQDSAIECFTDNKTAYDLCHRFTSAQNSRHIDRKMFQMRELRGAGVVAVCARRYRA